MNPTDRDTVEEMVDAITAALESCDPDNERISHAVMALGITVGAVAKMFPGRGDEILTTAHQCAGAFVEGVLFKPVGVS